jgi:hypothetical protein
MTTKMITIDQHVQLSLIRSRIPLKARNPFLDSTAKPRTDLKNFIGCTTGLHGRLPAKKFIKKTLSQSQVFSTSADIKECLFCAPDYQKHCTGN